MSEDERRADDPSANTPRLLVTGARSVVAVTLLRALSRRATVLAGDSDPNAVGFYLVPPNQRVRLPAAEDPAFVRGLLEAATRVGCDLVIPTGDDELSQVSQARAAFADRGIRVLVESPATLEICWDRVKLIERCEHVVRVPRTVVLDHETRYEDIERLGRPFAVVSRCGTHDARFTLVDDVQRVKAFPSDASLLAQEYLPGVEHSIDVLSRPDGHVVASVPRECQRDDEQRSRLDRTVHDTAVQDCGRLVAGAVGSTGVINVRTRHSADGTPTLVEVTPRFPDTVALTIAAGVNMPLLAVDYLLGWATPDENAIDFDEASPREHPTEVGVGTWYPARTIIEAV